MKAQARIERITGVSADAVVNTFHFMVPTDGDAAAATAASDIIARLTTFYQAIDIHMPAQVLAPLVKFRVYTLADPIPRAPVQEGSAALTLSAVAPLPAELAVCLSYNAFQDSGVPVARTRGRIYIGPLIQDWLTPTSEGDVRPNLTKNTAIRDAGVVLGDDTQAYRWCVWSPTDLAARAIINVSTDNAFDVQRRRGAKATARVRTST